MKVWKSNLLAALYEAIRSRGEWEKQNGYTSDSAMLVGWKQMMEVVKRGDSLEVIGLSEDDTIDLMSFLDGRVGRIGLKR